MTRREEWIAHCLDEEMAKDEHPYSKRFLLICHGIVDKIKADPNYEPPTYESVMADAPWGP